MIRCSAKAYAACPTSAFCGSVDDATFAEGSECDLFNQSVDGQFMTIADKVTGGSGVTTESIVHWLRDKAARAGDHSYQRMMSIAAQRLEELSRVPQWELVSDGLPPTHHEVYEEPDDDPLEFDISEEVIGITVGGDLIVARYTQEDGQRYWYDVDAGDVVEIDRWMPDPRQDVRSDYHGPSVD